MFRSITVLSLLWFWIFSSLTAYAAESSNEFIEGINYERIVPPLPGGTNGRVEVRELFWYGCPHCFNLEPTLTAWRARKADYIDFIPTPAIFNNPVWQLHATTFYTAEVLNILEKIHTKLFDAIHVAHRPLNTETQIRDFFMEQAGVSGEDFDKAFNSFSVKAKTARAADLSKKTGINGVPAVIINGKYRVDAALAGGIENIPKIIDLLAAQELAATTKP